MIKMTIWSNVWKILYFSLKQLIEGLPARLRVVLEAIDVHLRDFLGALPVSVPIEAIDVHLTDFTGAAPITTIVAAEQVHLTDYTGSAPVGVSAEVEVVLE